MCFCSSTVTSIRENHCRLSSTFPQDELTVSVNKIAIWKDDFDIVIQWLAST